MAQPFNDEQRYGDEQLAEPGALFDPEVHDPILLCYASGIGFSQQARTGP